MAIFLSFSTRFICGSICIFLCCCEFLSPSASIVLCDGICFQQATCDCHSGLLMIRWCWWCQPGICFWWMAKWCSNWGQILQDTLKDLGWWKASLVVVRVAATVASWYASGTTLLSQRFDQEKFGCEILPKGDLSIFNRPIQLHWFLHLFMFSPFILWFVSSVILCICMYIL